MKLNPTEETAARSTNRIQLATNLVEAKSILLAKKISEKDKEYNKEVLIKAVKKQNPDGPVNFLSLYQPWFQSDYPELKDESWYSIPQFLFSSSDGPYSIDSDDVYYYLECLGKDNGSFIYTIECLFYKKEG